MIMFLVKDILKYDHVFEILHFDRVSLFKTQPWDCCNHFYGKNVGLGNNVFYEQKIPVSPIICLFLISAKLFFLNNRRAFKH